MMATGAPAPTAHGTRSAVARTEPHPTPTATPEDSAPTTRSPRARGRERRLTQLHAIRRHVRGSLVAWPVILPFAAYILWWALGVGDTIWILCAVGALITWAGGRGRRLPTLATIWLLFLLWAAASLAMVDTTGRLVGALYRLSLYAAAGLLGLHAYQATDRLTTRRFLTAMTLFLLSATLGGYLALAAPQLVIHTPMSYLLPHSLLNNDLVNEMVIRRTTQWNPNAWIVQAPRPSAPFLYANTWGNVYSLLAPLAIVHTHLEMRLRSKWRWAVVAICAASAPVAVLTLNRGMFVGLGVVALWVGVQKLRAAQWKAVLTGTMAISLATIVWAFSPAGEQLSTRVETTNSTQDRFTLYWHTIEAVAGSPLLGFGSPRPAQYEWLPSLGTQGQLWTVLYSHGLIGALLFVGFFLAAFVVALPRTDSLGAVLGGIILATLVETLFYGMMTGIMISVLAVFILLRGDTVPRRAHSRHAPRPGERYLAWAGAREGAPRHTPYALAPHRSPRHARREHVWQESARQESAWQNPFEHTPNRQDADGRRR